MRTPQEVENEVVQAVQRFEREQMALRPTAIVAQVREQTLFVLLEGISPPAEQVCAGQGQGQDLIEAYHAELFAAGREELERELSAIVGRDVVRSSFKVDPVAGTGVMQFALEAPSG